MTTIDTIQALEDLYVRKPGAASLDKVAQQMTPLYRKWIMASQFCILSTVGREGTDASPRGDDGPVVVELDSKTLAMPDWRGNYRLDSLRNIVEDGRVSLMFMVPGSNNVVRVNGTGYVSVDPDLIGRFNDKSRFPTSVTVIKIAEIYSQCARAIMRAQLWSDQSAPDDLPSVGEMLEEMNSKDFNAKEYDSAWPARAAKTMW